MQSMEVHKIHDIILFRETMLSYCQKKFLQIKGDVNVIEEVSGGKFTDSEGRRLFRTCLELFTTHNFIKHIKLQKMLP